MTKPKVKQDGKIDRQRGQKDSAGTVARRPPSTAKARFARAAVLDPRPDPAGGLQPGRGSPDISKSPGVGGAQNKEVKGAAKPQMAARPAPVASPRPESIGMESTSPAKVGAGKLPPHVSKARDPLAPGPHPTALPPESGPVSAFGQRQVMWYHHPDNFWVMGLVWTEHENLHKITDGKDAAKPESQVVRMLKCYHILYRTGSGGVTHAKIRPDDKPHLDATRATTSRDQFEIYLRECLQKFGGPREAWALLGVEPPKLEVQPAPESAPSHAELYERAARLLDTTIEALREKYGHLNPGLQAMNLRNRLRAKGHNV